MKMVCLIGTCGLSQQQMSRVGLPARSSSPWPLPVLFSPVAGSTKGGAGISSGHLHQSITVGLESCAVGHSKALAAALLAALLAHEGRHHCLIALIQGCVHLIQQEQP